MINPTFSKRLFLCCLTLVSVGAGCGDDDGGNQNQGQDAAVSGGYITVDITYPATAIDGSHRPSVVVYAHEDYSDFSARPTGMPMAALLGTAGSTTVSGQIMDLVQVDPYLFENGTYSVVAGVAAASGMPTHVAGTSWIARSVTIASGDQTLTLDASDTDWKE